MVNRPAPPAAYKPTHHVRIVTAASLFDGHDAAINVMRRIMQAAGAEVIHLGHNRSVAEIVNCAIQEDVQGIAITSYQGGHVEYFKYMLDLLRERGAQIKVFGGGGGTILPSEIEELHAYGVARIYSPDDGRAMGLQGMINDLLRQCDFAKPAPTIAPAIAGARRRATRRRSARLITVGRERPGGGRRSCEARSRRSSRRADERPVLGITGTGGAGKSSLVDELVRRFLADFPDKTIAVISVDPSKRKSGGALLGDRIRMNAIDDPRVYMRSLATRQSNLALSKHVRESIEVCRAAGFDLVDRRDRAASASRDTEITEHADVSLYVMTAEYGAATQLEKIDMLDFADVDRDQQVRQARLARRAARRAQAVQAQPQRSSRRPTTSCRSTARSRRSSTIPGMNALYRALMDLLVAQTGAPLAVPTSRSPPA